MGNRLNRISRKDLETFFGFSIDKLMLLDEIKYSIHYTPIRGTSANLYIPVDSIEKVYMSQHLDDSKDVVKMLQRLYDFVGDEQCREKFNKDVWKTDESIRVMNISIFKSVKNF